MVPLPPSMAGVCECAVCPQNFTEVLSEKTLEMRKEARKTDRLLYQMLPRQVAMQLKGGQQVSKYTHFTESHKACVCFAH